MAGCRVEPSQENPAETVGPFSTGAQHFPLASRSPHFLGWMGASGDQGVECAEGFAKPFGGVGDTTHAC